MISVCDNKNQSPFTLKAARLRRPFRAVVAYQREGDFKNATMKRHINKTKQHRKVVWSVCNHLHQMGFNCKVMPENNCPYDILINGIVRIEIKTSYKPKQSKTSKSDVWNFNIHRKGLKKVGTADFFILYFKGLDKFKFRYGLRIVVPASKVENKFTVSITLRSLLLRWANYINKWHQINDFLNSRSALSEHRALLCSGSGPETLVQLRQEQI